MSPADIGVGEGAGDELTAGLGVDIVGGVTLGELAVGLIAGWNPGVTVAAIALDRGAARTLRTSQRNEQHDRRPAGEDVGVARGVG